MSDQTPGHVPPMAKPRNARGPVRRVIAAPEPIRPPRPTVPDDDGKTPCERDGHIWKQAKGFATLRLFCESCGWAFEPIVHGAPPPEGAAR